MGKIDQMDSIFIRKYLSTLPEEYYREHGIKSLRIFGSRLHGTAKEDSDVDLLVEFEPGRRIGYFGLTRIQLDLSDGLGIAVDLRTPGELSHRFRSRVLKEAALLYER